MKLHSFITTGAFDEPLIVIPESFPLLSSKLQLDISMIGLLDDGFPDVDWQSKSVSI